MEPERTGYNIIYNDNNGNIFKKETTIKTRSMKITNLSPTKSGKHFIGYSSNKDADIPDYFPNGINVEYEKDNLLYAIYINQNNNYKDPITNDSLIGAISQINTGGEQVITANSKQYSANVILINHDLVLNGEDGVEGATLSNLTYEFGDKTRDVATISGNYAKNMVVLKVNGNLTINNNVSVTSCKDDNGYGGPKGMFIYATGTFSNNGTISMTARGAYAVGEDVYLWKNKEYTEQENEYEYIPAVGGNGGTSVTSKAGEKWGYKNGNKGQDGNKRATGGGGSGSAASFYYASGTSGAGGNGTSYSGGAGGGGQTSGGGGSSTAESGSNIGGLGGIASAYRKLSTDSPKNAGGGAGNPGGKGQDAPKNSARQYVTDGRKGKDGTGGLLIVYGKKYINKGNGYSNGVMGGKANSGDHNSSGGSSGGGSINIFYKDFIDDIKLYNTNGGESVPGDYTYSGAGGNGTITIGSIETGNFIEYTE